MQSMSGSWKVLQRPEQLEFSIKTLYKKERDVGESGPNWYNSIQVGTSLKASTPADHYLRRRGLNPSGWVHIEAQIIKRETSRLK